MGLYRRISGVSRAGAAAHPRRLVITSPPGTPSSIATPPNQCKSLFSLESRYFLRKQDPRTKLVSLASGRLIMPRRVCTARRSG